MSAPSAAELRRLIRGSCVLDPVLKRSWLGVLPAMAPVHRSELAAILALERSDEVPRAAAN